MATVPFREHSKSRLQAVALGALRRSSQSFASRMRPSAYWSRYLSVASSNWEELTRGLIGVGHARSLGKRLDRVEKQVREEREAVHILLVLV